jgi:hypothetical protein
MKFLITMNMPAYRGGPIHQIICEYPANSLADFCAALERHDFTVVEEFYKDSDAVFGVDPPYKSQGLTAVNYRYVGKIKEFSDMTNGNKNRRYGD